MNVLELPAEILGKIFDHYVHDRWKVRHRQMDRAQALSKLRRIAAYSNSQTHPVDLTHVCQLWRITAISMPQLWATIHAFEIASEGDVKMFELWLERSARCGGTYPLTLTMTQKESRDQEVPVQCFGEAISLAISQHQRWEHIYLWLYRDSQPFFEPLYAVAPLSTLREFRVDFNRWGPDGVRHLIGALCSSTELRSIQFGKQFYKDLRRNRGFDIVPWDRLTTLSFLVLQPGDLIRILSSSMDTLQHISVSMLILPLTVDGSTPISYVTMRRLQSLRITSLFNGSHASEMFDKLTLPSLRELYLPEGFTVISDLRARGWESLLSLLERSNCKLQAFEIGDNETTVIENLKSPLFEHLTNLMLPSVATEHPNVSLQLLDALSEACEETQRPRMLPLLETLRLDFVHLVDRVREMVSARVAAYGGYGRSKLRRVCAQYIGGEEYALEMDLNDRE
ncbi:hypothetical protein EST38_g5499 [Candolleomyces aberdarensis]|uniref:F-box domain-containing protein n=1 Tax=Candolleomyces aberdarensis TaxID=2316362 RepID=A0A4Q2DM16_9AGAR|nr:hypothetical protein EST38_g5499 [Candolleomyces aberdarensis]